MMTRHPLAAGALLASALCLAACGKDDDEAEVPPPVEVPAPPPPAAEVVIRSLTEAGTLTSAQLDARIAASNASGLVGAARCDVQMLGIEHETPAPDGSVTTASGVLMFPSGPGCPPGPYGLVSYSRGTDLDQARAMAAPGDSEATLVAAMLAGEGLVVAASDYLGYAASVWPHHPYLHAASEAATNLALLRAARQVATARGVALNDSVYVTGYSQGGHASMATQQAIQAAHRDEFALAAAGYMSGPYVLTGSVDAAFEAMPLGTLGSTYYVPFAITALRQVDPTLYATPSQFFRAPYDSTVENLFPGPADVSVIDLIEDDKLPLLFSSLVTDEFVLASKDPSSPLSRALAANSPMQFAPVAPTLLCGGSRDPVVDFSNTATAAARFTALGSGQVSVLDVEQEPAWADRLRDDLIPVDFHTGYHASLVPPLCLLQVRNLFLSSGSPASTAGHTIPQQLQPGDEQ